MKRFFKLLSILAIVALLTVSLSIGVSANSKSGVDIIPITDSDYWEVQAGENFYDVVGCDGAWLDAKISAEGALTIKCTTDSEVGWPRIRSLQEERMPILDLDKNPNFYYDLTVPQGVFCQIQLTFAGTVVKMCKYISQQTPGTTFEPVSEDMGPGTYKGFLNIKKVITDSKILGFTGKTMIPQVSIYVVDLAKAGAAITIRSMSIGNEVASDGNGPKLDSNINGAAAEPTATTAPVASVSKSTTASVSNVSNASASLVSTTSGTSSATSSVKNAPGLETDDTSSAVSSSSAAVAENEGLSVMAIVLIAIIATILVLVGAAAAVYFLVIKKKSIK